jgi:hypothetical protein
LEEESSWSLQDSNDSAEHKEFLNVGPLWEEKAIKNIE